MPVRELLATHTSQELSEWRAYEMMYGFANREIFEALASIQEQVQMLCWIGGLDHIEEGGDSDDNPIPRPTPYPRPKDRRPKFSFEIDIEEWQNKEG